MNELTITLTGQAAQDYVNQEGRYDVLTQKYFDAVNLAKTTASKYDAEVDKNIKLLDKIDELTIKLDETEMDLNCERLGTNNNPISEKDTTSSDVIESSPIPFLAHTNKSKPKSGTHWTEDELDVIKRSLESNYTLAFLKVKLANRSEAAIRSMLLNYGVGVKNNKLYAK